MLMSNHHNSVSSIARYFFGTKTKFSFASPEGQEILLFWKSLTQDERAYYHSLDLKTGLPCVEQVCGHHIV